jgi:hypothetical protein
LWPQNQTPRLLGADLGRHTTRRVIPNLDVHRSGGGNCAPESERGPRIADASGSNAMAVCIVIDV